MGADCGAVDAVVAAICHDLGQRHRYGLPDPGLTPTPEPLIDGVPATVFRRHVAPWSATSKPPENAVYDGAILLRPPASSTIFRPNRQQALQNAPFCFGEIAPAQTRLQKAALNQPSCSASTPVQHLHRINSLLVLMTLPQMAKRLIERSDADAAEG